jgi:hypothetical protein
MYVCRHKQQKMTTQRQKVLPRNRTKKPVSGQVYVRVLSSYKPSPYCDLTRTWTRDKPGFKSSLVQNTFLPFTAFRPSAYDTIAPPSNSQKAASSFLVVRRKRRVAKFSLTSSREI